jgi:hypothetical protein
LDVDAQESGRVEDGGAEGEERRIGGKETGDAARRERNDN